MNTGNDGTGNIKERDTWQTPDKLFNELNNQYKFSFDCCASIENTKCFKYSSSFEVITKSVTGLKTCWMNPPFSMAYIMFDHFFKPVFRGVCIYRCDNMETKIWQDIILKNATWIFIPKGRISYEGMKGKGSRFPSALIGFNVEKPNLNMEGFLLTNPLKNEVQE